MKLAASGVSFQVDLARVIRTIEAVAFWSAIALPFLHVPLLLYGLETTAQVSAFLVLLGLNLGALLLGHGYKRR